ncbi:prephenate dehydrogenase [Parashewanella spongiae]|uniref:Prephenate dehydrogenase n=1 Tax=Parashewanella spongiae TaxID=342950 RepID=A0A3A6U7G6_9GAMM|nr:prephenate dehydrogenase [Parashewanella spongiae]MCL1078877.1 prephenate dehydrogenase [Parashewanella spongiae]RJY17849.1 prephenate dehydrogenase [Parashewanella spongiae]
MPYSKVFEQVQQNIQLAYRQAIDADARLDSLQQAGLGKFKAIFSKDQGFSTESNRFKPYVAELVELYDDIKKDAEPDTELLKDLVAQLGLVLQMMQEFKQKSK